MATVLGIYGSPREGGNTDLLLDRALEGSRSENADVSQLYPRKMRIEGCRACYGCETTGRCVVQDDMAEVYPLLASADAILLATPIFFYGPSAQVKALIDRCQCKWCGGVLRKRAGQDRRFDQGKGYLIAVGASKGEHLFAGTEWVAKYFFDALDMTFDGKLLVRGVDGKADILTHPEEMERARRFGMDVCGEIQSE